MSAAWWFLAGWLSAAVFIWAGLRLHHERRWRGMDAQDTEQFLQACDRVLGDTAKPAPEFSVSRAQDLRDYFRARYAP